MPFSAPRGDRPALPRRAPVADVRRQRPADAGAPEISLRPPFRVVWSRGLGSLIEFPAVVYEGVAYIGNYKGTIYALSMRDGEIVWRRRPARGKMASSPAVVGDESSCTAWTVSCACSTAATAGCAGRAASARRSSPRRSSRTGIDYFGAWNGRVYALDLKRRKLRWSSATGYKITSSAALAGRHALHRRLRRPPARALARDRHGSASSRSVNGRIYGTPAVAGRPRLRALVDRRQPDGVLDRGPLPLARRHGLVRLLVARGLGGARLLRLVQRPLLLASRELRPRPLVRRRRRAGLGRGRRRRRRRLRRQHWGRITGVDAKTGRVVLRFPHGEYVPVSGNGGRLLLHGYSRIYAVEQR